ncbi:hypothetical protein [Baekduia sp. Peel2402]|uniref:hypothetical protein n=1 Tax=Baekduia sp. Peel2402 TaxID=3458296 RepID=UPI00403E949A
MLGVAAQQQLEAVTDGFWPDDESRRGVRHEQVMTAARTVDSWEAGCLTVEETVLLTRHAIEIQQPEAWPPFAPWPETIAAVDDLIVRATLTRDLILLRDTLGHEPPSLATEDAASPS